MKWEEKRPFSLKLRSHQAMSCMHQRAQLHWTQASIRNTTLQLSFLQSVQWYAALQNPLPIRPMRSSSPPLLSKSHVSLKWCERCCFCPSDTGNYIIYVHATQRKERSHNVTALAVFWINTTCWRINMLNHPVALSHAHTYMYTQFFISREREKDSISVPCMNNNTHQIHSKPRNNSSSTRAQFEYRAFTTMVPI